MLKKMLTGSALCFLMIAADAQQDHEQPHVQEIDRRGLPSNEQFDVRRNRMQCQQKCNQPRFLATERGEDDGFRKERQGKREPADLGS